jgi:hypothetical protein
LIFLITVIESSSATPFISFPSPRLLDLSLSLSLISLSLLLTYLLISSGFHIANMLSLPRSKSLRRLTSDTSQSYPNRTRRNRRAFWLILLALLFLNLELLVGLIISTTFSSDPGSIEDQIDFGRILARRILKALGRGFLVMGVSIR